MAIFRILVFFFIVIITISFFKTIKLVFFKYSSSFAATNKRIYRLFNVKNRSIIVWKELIKLHKNENWYFGQFDNEKYLITTFNLNNQMNQKFRFEIIDNRLVIQTYVLESFDENKTTEIMILATHLNSLLNFGMVNVNTKHNYVEYFYNGDLVTYMLYPGEIFSDIRTHYNVTIDCLWAFNNLIETNEDPVFVISELLKRKNETNNTNE